MTIERIHQEVKFRLNKLNSNHKEDFPVEYIDDGINKVTNDYIEIFYAGNLTKPYKLGFEVTQQRIDMLSSLVVPEVFINLSLFGTDIYSANLASLALPYKHYLRGYVTSTQCAGKKIPVTIVTHNNLDRMLRDVNQQPSLKWNRCLGVFKDGKLFLYTNGFTINRLYIEYLRQPVKVFFGGYDSLEYLEGDTTAYKAADPSVTSDLPEDYHDLLVDMVVQYLSSVIEDANTFNFQKEKINSLI